MKFFNITNILFIGLSILFIICISASYNIYLDSPSKKAFYIIENKDYEVKKFKDLYFYAKNNVSKEDYKLFTKNLDKESKKEVDFIIDTSLLVLNAKDLGHKVVMPFTNRQANEIKKFYKFVYTLKGIDDSTFQYGKYNLPKYDGSVHVLYNKYGIEKIKHKNRIKNKAIIDAGAYIGDSSIVLAEYTRNKVYAFEPVEENYEKLLKTIRFNKMEKRIIPEKYCLSNNNKPKTIYVYLNHLYGANSKHGDIKHTVNTVTVDDFVNKNNLKVGIIKSDIEGDEMKLLEGAKNTIINQKPVLLISIYHSGKDFFEIKKWIENLNLNYKFRIMRTKPDDILDETILIAE